MGHDDADLADLAGLAGAVRVLRRQVEELRDGGSGVVVPWIPVAFRPVRAQDLPAVTSHTFETAWEARFTKLYPLVGLSTVQGYDFGAAEVVATDLETGSTRWSTPGPCPARWPGVCGGLTSWRMTGIPMRSGSPCGTGALRGPGRTGVRGGRCAAPVGLRSLPGASRLSSVVWHAWTDVGHQELADRRR
jgi:hypothetical protein